MPDAAASDLPAYERDPRLTRLETEVVEAGTSDGRPFVVLADTVLYPEGGGQPADHGTVGGIAVTDVRKVDGRIHHFLAAPAPAGRVMVEVDWPRRFDHMQQHTGQHLLTAIADGRFGWHTTAFHLGERRCDIELDVPRLTAEELSALEEAVAQEIRAARPVSARRVTGTEFASLPVRTRGLPAGHSGSVRLIEIAGVDLNTCGGTHCASTAELEALALLGTEPVRGGVRLFYVAGARVRKLLGEHERRNAALREALGTSDDDLVARVAARQEQLREAERTVRDLEEALAVASAEALVAAPGAVVSGHWPDRGLPFLQRVAREVGERASDRMVFLTCGAGEEGAFVLACGADVAVDLPSLGSQVAELLGGRGGGSGRIFQGKASRLSRRAEADGIVRGASERD